MQKTFSLWGEIRLVKQTVNELVLWNRDEKTGCSKQAAIRLITNQGLVSSTADDVHLEGD